MREQSHGTPSPSPKPLTGERRGCLGFLGHRVSSHERWGHLAYAWSSIGLDTWKKLGVLDSFCPQPGMSFMSPFSKTFTYFQCQTAGLGAAIHQQPGFGGRPLSWPQRSQGPDRSHVPSTWWVSPALCLGPPFPPRVPPQELGLGGGLCPQGDQAAPGAHRQHLLNISI